MSGQGNTSPREIEDQRSSEVHSKRITDGPRLLVCGGRAYNEGDVVFETLEAFQPTLIVGDASGADWLARTTARHLKWNLNVRWADWNLHGRQAGPIRNQEMVDLGADLLIAFPGGNGTADCVRRAERAGIPVRRVE